MKQIYYFIRDHLTNLTYLKVFFLSLDCNFVDMRCFPTKKFLSVQPRWSMLGLLNCSVENWQEK